MCVGERVRVLREVGASTEVVWYLVHVVHYQLRLWYKCTHSLAQRSWYKNSPTFVQVYSHISTGLEGPSTTAPSRPYVQKSTNEHRHFTLSASAKLNAFLAQSILQIGLFAFDFAAKASRDHPLSTWALADAGQYERVGRYA